MRDMNNEKTFPVYVYWNILNIEPRRKLNEENTKINSALEYNTFKIFLKNKINNGIWFCLNNSV